MPPEPSRDTTWKRSLPRNSRPGAITFRGRLYRLFALVHAGGFVVLVRLGAGFDGVVTLLDLLVDHALERFDRLRARQVAAVDEERRRPAHAQLGQLSHA